MTISIRRLLAALGATVLAVAAVVGFAALPASASEGDSTAVAVNTRDGASIFRLAFNVRRVADGVVDQGNAAAAVASCTDCETVALAFQVVMVFGDTESVTPENLALAYNQECSSCLTYAAATQLVLGFDGPVRLTADGNRRLADLRTRLLALGREEDLTLDELNAAVAEARAELRDIFTTEVMPAGAPDGTDTATADGAGDAEDATTTTTARTGDGDESSTTTTPSTSTTSVTSTSTTTTVADGDSTTTTSTP